MATYGVTPEGFVRKPLPVILAEIEERNVEVFGPSVIQTAQSPLGQLNGIRADIIAAVWEIAEDVYQSYSVDGSEGSRLDILSRLRLIERATGELDPSLRQAITNAGVANVRDADFDRAIKNIAGVTWSKVWSNDTGSTDANAMPANSVTVAALGGDNEAIATVARQFIVPGITIHGNVAVDTNIDGYCRTIRITRPVERRVRAELTVSKSPTRKGCPAPTDAAIAATFVEAFTGDERPVNGEDVTIALARSIVVCAHPGVEITGLRLSFDDGAFADAPLAIGFNEIASIAIADVTVIDT